MKKNILIFLILFISSNTFAQNFALKSGISLSNLTTYDEPLEGLENDTRTGFVFGFISEIGENNIKYSYGILFNQKGSEQLKFNAVDFQLKGNFYFNDEISLNIGPSLSYLVSGKIETLNGNTQIKDDDWDLYNRIDYSSCFGLSYKINDLLNVDFSYSIGFGSITNSDYLIDLYSSSSILSVSYIFDY